MRFIHWKLWNRHVQNALLINRYDVYKWEKWKGHVSKKQLCMQIDFQVVHGENVALGSIRLQRTDGVVSRRPKPSG